MSGWPTRRPCDDLDCLACQPLRHWYDGWEVGAGALIVFCSVALAMFLTGHFGISFKIFESIAEVLRWISQ